MDSGNIFDEVIQLKNFKKNDEVEKHSISEEFTSKEWINYIVKKGFTIQRKAMINKIPYLTEDKQTVEFIFLSIINYIEIWDDSLQIALANTIYTIYNSSSAQESYILHSNMSGIVNLIIRFCMKIISTEVTNISEEYLHALNAIVKYYSSFKKIKLDADSADYACNMGSFGKSSACRRFSVYFCSCLVQISEEYHQELYSRLMILSSDTDASVRLEWAYHFRFLFREYLDEKYINQSLIKSVDSFWDDDEPAQKVEILISIVANLNSIGDDAFIQGIVQKIVSVFETLTSQTEHVYVIRLFDALVSHFEECGENIIKTQGNYLKTFFNVVKFFIKKHISNKDISNHPTPMIFKTLIDKFPILYSIFKSYNEIGYMSDILNFLFKNFTFFQDVFSDNLEIIINSISNNDSATIKVIAGKLAQIIEEKEKIPILVRRLTYILPSLLKKTELISIFYQKFEIFEDYLKEYLKKGWIEVYYFLKAFNLSESESIFENYEFLKKMYKLVIGLIVTYVSYYACNISSISGNYLTKSDQNSNINYKIVKVCLRILAILLKYSFKSNREEILKYLEKLIIENNSFYIRRLFIPFLKKSIKILSITYLKENLIIDNYLKFFDDSLLILPLILKLLKSIFPLMSDDTKIKFVILNKIEELRSRCTIDKIALKALYEYDKWYNSFISDSDFALVEMLKLDSEKLQSEKIFQIRETNLALNEKKDENVKKLKKIGNKKINSTTKNNLIPNTGILSQTGNNKKTVISNTIQIVSPFNAQNNPSNSNTINVNLGRRGSCKSIDKTKKIIKESSIDKFAMHVSIKEQKKDNKESSSEKAKLVTNNVRNLRNVLNNTNLLVANSSNNINNYNSSNNSNNVGKKKK